MNWSSPHADSAVCRKSRWRRWLIPAALLAIAPKCVLCVLAYAGLGTALGLVGPELCGADNAASAHWAAWLPALGVALAAGSVVRQRIARRRRRHQGAGVDRGLPKERAEQFFA